MGLRLAVATAVVVLALTSSAMAQSWVQVGPTPPDHTLYYDSTSKTRDGNFGVLLSMASYGSPQTDPAVASGSITFYSRSHVMIFDCTTREVAAIGDFMFHAGPSAGGAVVFRSQAYDQTRRPVNSGTANEAMYQVACQ